MMQESPMQTVLVLFAHPDDEANGLGGTLWLLKDRYRIVLLCLTRGERGLSRGHVEAEPEVGRIREAELRAAADLLGAEVRFLDRIDGEVYADREICERVADSIRELQPALFLSMWPFDLHPDHAAASEIARKAIRLAKYSGEFWMFEEGMHQTFQFDPDLCVDISAVLEEKRRLIRCHVCQNADDRMVIGIEQVNRFRGMKAGFAYAEAFKSFQTRRAGQPSILESLGG